MKVTRLGAVVGIFPNTTTHAVGLNFKLSDVTSYTEFTGLFMYFRIKKIVVVIAPQFNVQTISGTDHLPYLIYSVNHRDAATPTESALLERYNAKRVMQWKHPVKIVLKPAVTLEVYESVTGTGYTPRFNQWISTADAVTEHYGLQLFIGDTATTQDFRVQTRYFLEFKNVT